jgi:RimJ/RimL family protein N-acetyltransferase
MTSLLTTPKGNITIRPTIPTDAIRLRLLRLEALASDPEAFAADHDLSAAESAEKWAERIASSDSPSSSVICIAEWADHLIGMTGLGPGHWPKTKHSAYVWGVYVNTEWRGLHIAQALIEECSTWGRAHGVEIIKLGVVTSNTSAIRCYSRMGFTVYGVEPKTLFHKGTYFDELLMSKSIE